MFSENRKISERQLQALLITDWLGKALFLLPLCVSGQGVWQMFFAAAAGLGLDFLFLHLTRQVLFAMEKNGESDFYAGVCKRIGKVSGLLLYLIFTVYVLAQCVLLLVLCIQIAGEYFLLELSPIWLGLLPAGAGYFLAVKGLEPRGRMSELLVSFLVLGYLLMLAFALAGIQPGKLGGAETIIPAFRADPLQWTSSTGTAALQIMALFGGIGLLPLVQSNLQEKGKLLAAEKRMKNRRKSCDAEEQFAGRQGHYEAAVYLADRQETRDGGKHLAGKGAYHALWLLAAILLLTDIGLAGTFGSEGIQRQKWPVLALMSSSKLPGHFIQRWDILLAALLLVSLFLSISAAIYYGGVTGRVLGLSKKWGRILILLLGYGIACFAAVQKNFFEWYRGISFGICVPVIFLTIILLWVMERAKTWKTKGVHMVSLLLLFLLLPALLGGCSARELENRTFPIVLEMGTADGKFVLGCGWPEATETETPETEETEEQEESENRGDANLQEMEQNGETELERNQSSQNSEKNNEDNHKDGKDMWTERNDASITRVSGDTVEAAVQAVQQLRDRFVDYSQVRAILWQDGLTKDANLQNQTMRWLEENPAFSRNILIFYVKDGELTLEQVQQRSEGQPGAYLENLERNQNRWKPVTLKEQLYD